MHHQIMKLLLFFILSCFTAVVSVDGYSSQIVSLPNHPPIVFPDFDQGVIRNGMSKKKYVEYIHSKDSSKRTVFREQLSLLRNSYNQCVSLIQKRASSETPEELHIPRIVHQIWLGSPVPDKYQEWMTTWMNWHGWEYKLWTDEEVKKLSLVNQAIYDAVSNYGQKSDILRMELLYMMGGIYVDTDFECLRADFFEILHNHVDFYVGIEPLEHARLRINNAIIGSAPGHPLLAKMLQELPAHFESTKKKWALVSTGPVFMTKVIYAYLKEDHSETNLFLPCSLVYPFTSSEVDRSPSHDTLVPMKETVAIHYWSKSWVKLK